MWAREWFENVAVITARVARAEERAERIRAMLEGGAIRYDAQPGGGGGDLDTALIEADLLAKVLADGARRYLDVAGDLLFGDEGASRALGEEPAYAVHLHYIECMSYKDAARRLGCSKSWAVAQAEKCIRWLDANRERP